MARKEKVIKFIESAMLGFVFMYALLDMYNDHGFRKREIERSERQHQYHQEIMELEARRHQEMMKLWNQKINDINEGKKGN